MRQIILLLVTLFLGFTLIAQKWTAPVYRIDGKPDTKTIKLTPRMDIEIGRLVVDNDSQKETKNLYGYFQGVIGDTLQMNLEKIRIKNVYTNGTRIDSYIPAKSFIAPGPDSTYIMNIAVNDIDYLAYSNKSISWLTDTEDFFLFGSLMVLIASPFICYDYKNHTFNAERYQYWGLGSTLGIVTGFSLQFLGGATKKRFHFNSSWSDKKTKVWSFEGEERLPTP